ncbi:hypothetical protein Tco_0316799 [Tanacetum coccineum]
MLDVSDKEPKAHVEASQLPVQAPPSPDYVPGPEHPPLPDYEDPEEDPEEDPANYPTDGGDEEEEEESSGDDADDKVDEEASEDEDEEEEEHLASADSTTLPVVDPVPSAKDTYAFKTDESAPTPLALITAVAAVLPLSSPPASLLLPWLSLLPQIPSPPLPVQSPPLPLPSPPTHTSPTCAEAPLGYRVAMIQWRAASPSTHHPLEIPSPLLLLPSTTYRDDLPEADMPLQKRVCFTAPTGRFEVGESSSAAATRQAGHTLAYRVYYGFVDIMDASIRAAESRAITTVGEVKERVTNLATTQSLQRDVDVLQRQRIRDEDRLTSHIQHEYDRFRELVCTAEAGPQDGPADAGSSC